MSAAEKLVANLIKGSENGFMNSYGSLGIFQLHEFRYNPPVESIVYPLFGGICYVALIWGLQHFNFGPVKPSNMENLRIFALLHNVLLISVSLWMGFTAALACYERYTIEHGFIDALICTKRDPEHLYDGVLGAVTYLFYVTKYYEWVDTVILVLQGKKLLFLHVYHHAVMPLVCWTWFAYPWLEGAWYCVVLNSFIHVIMYTYYALATVGVKPKYKFIVTVLQIWQFITGMLVVFWFMWMRRYRECSGNVNTALFSQLVNVSFLGLFLYFFFQEYVSGSAKTRNYKKVKQDL